MRDFFMPKSVCPHCQHTLDGCSDLTNLHSPSPGDFSVCIRCGGFLQFTDGLGVQASELSALFSLAVTQPKEYRILLVMSQGVKEIQEGDRHEPE